MATLELSDISAVMNLIFGEKAVRQFRTDLTLANLIAVKPDKNAVCTWGVKIFDRSTAGPQNEGYDPVEADFSHNKKLQASLPWTQYYGFGKVSGLAQALAAANGGGAIDMDALEEEVDDALDELGQKVGSHLYSGNVAASPTEFAGLAAAVDSTGVYAGIDQGVEASWASGEDTLALASLSIDNLKTKLHRPFKDATGRRPEFVMCPGNLWDAVSALFTDQTRQVVEAVRTEARGNVDLYALAGHTGIVIDKVVYLEDKDCTANTFYALHSKWLELRQVPAASSSMHPSAMVRVLKALTGQEWPEDIVAEMMAANDGVLTPTIEAIGKTGDNMKVMAKVYAQLRLTRRNGASKLAII